MGIVVERYRYPGDEYKFSLPAHCIALHLGHPIRMLQALDGKAHDGLFLADYVRLFLPKPRTCAGMRTRWMHYSSVLIPSF